MDEENINTEAAETSNPLMAKCIVKCTLCVCTRVCGVCYKVEASTLRQTTGSGRDPKCSGICSEAAVFG